MSLVITFATNDFAVIAGDLRRTHIEDDNVHFDDTPKAYKVNSQVLAGFTGDCDVSKYLINELKSLGDRATIEAAARKIKQLLKKFPREDIYQTIILNGVSDSGKMALIKLTHRSKFRIERISIPTGEIKWLYAYSYEDPNPFIMEKYETIEDCNIESIINLAKTVIEKVSETDIRVSKQCDVLGFIR